MIKRYLLFAVCCCGLLAGCAKSASSYYPLAAGTTWTYHMAITTPQASGEGTLILTNLPARNLGGRMATPQKGEAHFRGESHYTFEYVSEATNGVIDLADEDSGDAEPKLHNPAPYILTRPLKVGTNWPQSIDASDGQSISATATIESVSEMVDVPAGTYTGCVKVHVSAGMGHGRDRYEWYAPSVGLVKMIERVAGRVNTLQLVSFHP